MTTEQSTLIQVLADHINQRKTVVLDELDFDELKQISQQQQVTAIVYSQTKNPLFQSTFAQQVYHSKNQEALAQKISDSLTNASIHFC